MLRAVTFSNISQLIFFLSTLHWNQVKRLTRIDMYTTARWQNNPFDLAVRETFNKMEGYSLPLLPLLSFLIRPYSEVFTHHYITDECLRNSYERRPPDLSHVDGTCARE